MLLQCLHECNGYKRVTAGQEEPHFHCPECKMSSANKKEVVMHIMDHASQKSHEAITELAQYNADGQKLNEQVSKFVFLSLYIISGFGCGKVFVI